MSARLIKIVRDATRFIKTTSYIFTPDGLHIIKYLVKYNLSEKACNILSYLLAIVCKHSITHSCDCFPSFCDVHLLKSGANFDTAPPSCRPTRADFSESLDRFLAGLGMDNFCAPQPVACKTAEELGLSWLLQ